MKKSGLLHPELSRICASIGHFHTLTLCDAGLPIPKDITRVDLALKAGIPSLLDTLSATLDEIHVGSVIMATEIKDVSPEMHQALVDLLHAKTHLGKDLPIEYVSHEAFKTQTHDSYAIVRTGECTPYANLILVSDVVFDDAG